MTKTPTIVKTESEWSRWLNNAMPGDICEYYRGCLAGDGLGSLVNRARPAKWQKKDVWNLAILGVVKLVQKRYGDLDYGYWAIRSHKIEPLYPDFPVR